MKVVYKIGNLLDDNADILVNCINDKGFMGGGIALAFKNKYPDMFNEYVEDCKKNKFVDSCYTLYIKNGVRILNLLTMSDDMQGSYTRTLAGLYNFAKVIKKTDVKSIAIPPCGCGIGGLNKSIIHDEILDIFKDCDVELRMYDFK